MSYILETPQKRKKSQRDINSINPLAASAAADENWLDANKRNEKYGRTENKSNARAPRKQIFHPVDGLY